MYRFLLIAPPSFCFSLNELVCNLSISRKTFVSLCAEIVVAMQYFTTHFVNIYSI